MAHVSLTSTPMFAPHPGSPVVIALDLGTMTGWTLQAADGLITSGTVFFRPGRYDGGGTRYLRFNWLTEMDRLTGLVSAIRFEEVLRNAATDVAHVYSGLIATLRARAKLRSVTYEGVPVGTIKRHATGKADGNKASMIAAARARGFTPADGKEADALALLPAAIETRRGVR